MTALRSDARELSCQECGGMGGYTEIVIDETGEGPWRKCGWCRGTGYVTPAVRGAWLAYRRSVKADMERPAPF